MTTTLDIPATVAVGENLQVTVQTQPKAFVIIYGGSRPGPDGKLKNAFAAARGHADDSGTFTLSREIHAGMKNNDYYVQALSFGPGQGESGISEIRGVTVRPANSTAKYICYPDHYENTETGESVTTERTIQGAIQDASPGDLILVKDGNFKKMTLDKEWTQYQDPIWVVAENFDKVFIERHDVGGSATVTIKRLGYVSFYGLFIQASDLYGVSFNTKQVNGYPNIHFYDCAIDGEWDHVKKEGFDAKWGVLGYDQKDFVWRGGYIQNIKREHAFYWHNSQGGDNGYAVTIEDCRLRHVGRTATQFVARSGDSNGYEGSGQITIRNVEAEDCNLGDFYGGGSTFTFAGRHRGPVLLQNVSSKAGFNADLNATAGKTVGTGAFVCYHGGGSDDVNTESIFVKDCDLQMAPEAGDRPHMQIAAVDLFEMETSTITSGDKEAMAIQTGAINVLNLDRASNVTGDCTVDDKKYDTYQQMLNDL